MYIYLLYMYIMYHLFINEKSLRCLEEILFQDILSIVLS